MHLLLNTAQLRNFAIGKGSVVDREPRNITPEVVAYFTLDKDRSNSKIRAVITYSIGKIVGVFGVHKTLRIAFETLGVMDKFGLTSFELAIEIGTDILAVIGKRNRTPLPIGNLLCTCRIVYRVGEISPNT